MHVRDAAFASRTCKIVIHRIVPHPDIHHCHKCRHSVIEIVRTDIVAVIISFHSRHFHHHRQQQQYHHPCYRHRRSGTETWRAGGRRVCLCETAPPEPRPAAEAQRCHASRLLPPPSPRPRNCRSSGRHGGVPVGRRGRDHSWTGSRLLRCCELLIRRGLDALCSVGAR